MTSQNQRNICINDRVKIVGKSGRGRVAFIGTTHFVAGKMFGVVLDEPTGRHNGTIDGVTYFQCPQNKGIFVRLCQLEREDSETPACSRSARYPNYLKSSSRMNLLKSKPENKQNQKSGIGEEEHKVPEPKKVVKQEAVSCPSAIGDSTIPPVPLQQEDAKELKMKLEAATDEVEALRKDAHTVKQQLVIARSYLSKLKTYFRWVKKCDTMKDQRLNVFLQHVIETTLRNAEDVLNQTVNSKEVQDRGDSVGAKRQNSFLFHHVVDLEKQTETLLETMLQVRSILILANKKQKKNVKTLTPDKQKFNSKSRSRSKSMSRVIKNSDMSELEDQPLEKFIDNEDSDEDLIEIQSLVQNSDHNNNSEAGNYDTRGPNIKRQRNYNDFGAEDIGGMMNKPCKFTDCQAGDYDTGILNNDIPSNINDPDINGDDPEGIFQTDIKNFDDIARELKEFIESINTENMSDFDTDLD